jgi:hypothetical protein
MMEPARTKEFDINWLFYILFIVINIEFILWAIVCYKFYFDLARFRASLLVANHLLTWKSTTFDILQKSWNFLLEVMMFVSLAYIMASDRVFIVGGR